MDMNCQANIATWQLQHYKHVPVTLEREQCHWLKSLEPDGQVTDGTFAVPEPCVTHRKPLPSKGSVVTVVQSDPVWSEDRGS